MIRIPERGLPAAATLNYSPCVTKPAKRISRTIAAGSAFGLYLILSVLFLGVRLPLTGWLLGIGNDPKSSVWFLTWWPWAIEHGYDPFWSHAVFAPAGYSMAWATSIATASLLALPATLTVGPVAAFNLLTLAAPALAGAGCFALAFEITANRTASAIAGFLFAFSGFEDGQLLGHLNLDLAFLVPIIVLLVYRRLEGGLSRNRFVVLLAAALVAQFGLSSELFATTVSLGLAVLLAATVLGRARRSVLIECLGALLLTALLITPMLASMWRGAADMPDFINSPLIYSNDVLNLVVPTGAEWLAPLSLRNISAQFTGNESEQDLYLGIPLLLMVLLFAFERGHGRARLFVTAVFAGLVVASLGPRLQIGGTRTAVPLPWALVTHLPLLRGALPCRIGLFVSLTASLAACIWMAAAFGGTRFHVLRRFALGCLACVFLTPGDVSRVWSSISRPCLFQPEHRHDRALQSGPILLLPFGSGDSMLWQAQARMGFSQAGGLLSFVPNSVARDPLTLPLLRNESEPNFGADLERFTRERDVSVVVAGPGTSDAEMGALRATGWARERVCADVVAFRRPGALPLDPAKGSRP